MREETPPQLTLTPEVANHFEDPAPVSPTQPKQAPFYEQTPPPITLDIGFDIDWVSIGLGLLTLLAVGGLIPFWMWVYFAYNP